MVVSNSATTDALNSPTDPSSDSSVISGVSGTSVSGTSDVIGVDDDSTNTFDTGMELEPTSSSSSEYRSSPTSSSKGEEEDNDFENVDSDNAEEVMSTDKAAEVKSSTGRSVERDPLLGKGLRIKKQTTFFGGTTQYNEIAKNSCTSVDRKEIGLHNSNANLCYINSMMRMLFYATDGSLERLLKTITDIGVHPPIQHFIQQLSSLWDFLRSEEINTSSYCMNAYLTAFKDLYAHRGLAARNWDRQQDAEEFLNIFFLLLSNDRYGRYKADDGFHGIQEINDYTYTQCTKCSKIQLKGETTCPHHVVVISQDEGNRKKLSFKELLEYTMQGAIDIQSEQQCSLCVDEIKIKILSYNKVLDFKQTAHALCLDVELKELGYSRGMTHKMCWKIREDQKFILVFVKKQINGKSTRKRHFSLPEGDFVIKENGIWNVWAVLLYTGQGHGATSM